MNIATDETELGLRERKKRATWAALHRAALTLVRERGLDQVTIDDIAAAADVSPRTFFNYFRTKEEAIIGTNPEHVAELAAELRDRPDAEGPVAAVRAVLLSGAERISEQQDLWEMRVAVATRHPDLFQSAWASSAQLEAALTRALAERMRVDVARSPLPGILAGMAVAIRRHAVRVWVLGRFSESYRDVLDRSLRELTALDLNGLTDPAGGGRP